MGDPPSRTAVERVMNIPMTSKTDRRGNITREKVGNLILKNRVGNLRAINTGYVLLSKINFVKSAFVDFITHPRPFSSFVQQKIY